MRYGLWRSPDGEALTFCRFDETQPADSDARRRAAIGPDDELLWTVEAASWEEACQARNDYLGWGPYVAADEDAGGA